MVVCIDVPRVERRNKVRVNSPPTSVLLLLLLQLQLQLLLTPLNTGTLFALRGQHALISFTRAYTASTTYITMSLSPLFRPSALARRTYTAARSYASQTPGNPMLEVFNRKTKHLQKDRAARNVEESRKVDYIKDEVAMRLCERLLVHILFLHKTKPKSIANRHS